MSEDLDSKNTPWMNVGMDWEGVAAALGALLVALLLGALWSPLFWIGFAGVVIALMAARWSPSATNKVYTPIAGSVESLIFEAGENTVPLAARADDDGLARAFLTFESRGQQVGVRLASGGFGPRIDLTTEAGDIVRLGRPFGTRRLGGWCDVFVPKEVGLLVWPGQTLVGGETVMGRLKSQGDTDLFDGMAEEDTDDEPVLQVDGDSQVEAEEEDDDEYPSPEDMETPDDPAVILARLREASRRHDD